MIPVNIVRVPKLFPPWVKARVSNRTIYVLESVKITRGFLAHELKHIEQRNRLGARFLFAYLWGWIRAGFRYNLNILELEAQEAERDPVYISWAERIINKEGAHG